MELLLMFFFFVCLPLFVIYLQIYNLKRALRRLKRYENR